jgi:hypothetical protein
LLPPSTPGVLVAALGNPLWDPNWLLGGGFRRSRCCWLGYHNRIGKCLRNIDRFPSRADAHVRMPPARVIAGPGALLTSILRLLRGYPIGEGGWRANPRTQSTPRAGRSFLGSTGTFPRSQARGGLCRKGAVAGGSPGYRRLPEIGCPGTVLGSDLAWMGSHSFLIDPCKDVFIEWPSRNKMP